MWKVGDFNKEKALVRTLLYKKYRKGLLPPLQITPWQPLPGESGMLERYRGASFSSEERGAMSWILLWPCSPSSSWGANTGDSWVKSFSARASVKSLLCFIFVLIVRGLVIYQMQNQEGKANLLDMADMIKICHHMTKLSIQNCHGWARIA